MLCHLLVYEIPLTTVETMEISSYLHRWKGFPCNLSSTALYEWISKLQLPISSLDGAGINGTGKAMLYCDSKDSKVAAEGKKLRAQEGLDIATGLWWVQWQQAVQG